MLPRAVNSRGVLSVFGVEPRRIGGVEMFARELSRQLGGRGWNSVLCFLAEPPGQVRRFLEGPNVSLEILENIVEPTTGTLRCFRALVKRRRPDIVHLYFTGLLSPYPWLARFSGASPVYFTDQGSQPEGYKAVRAALWKRAAGRIITRPLTRVICISDYNAACCATRGYVPRGRVCRIYNSVDLNRPSGTAAGFLEKHAIPPGRAVVLQVSWLIPEKGISDLLEAARLVLTANSAVHFVVAGDGAFREQYMADAARMGLADHFTWTGLIEDPLAEGVYAAADVVCQLSRWQEAFGWVVAEAMSCGKPVVATRVGGLPEIVQDGRTGFLVEPRRPEEAASRILQLLADRALSGAMGTAARQDVERRFNLEHNVAELIKLYGIPEAGPTCRS